MKKLIEIVCDLFNKALKLVGMDLQALSLDTVRMFARDAEQAGFKL